MASRKATKSRQRKLENSKLNELISKRLKSVLESPVLNTVDETTKISDIIKTPDKTIETGKLLKEKTEERKCISIQFLDEHISYGCTLPTNWGCTFPLLATIYTAKRQIASIYMPIL